MGERRRTIKKKKKREGREGVGREENFKVFGHTTPESKMFTVCRIGPQATALGDSLQFRFEGVWGTVPILFGLVSSYSFG